MIFFKAVEVLNSQKNRKTLRIFDWLCGFAALGYGLYVSSWLWIGSGIAALLIAWWDPATRITASLRTRIVKRPEV